METGEGTIENLAEISNLLRLIETKMPPGNSKTVMKNVLGNDHGNNKVLLPSTLVELAMELWKQGDVLAELVKQDHEHHGFDPLHDHPHVDYLLFK